MTMLRQLMLLAATAAGLAISSPTWGEDARPVVDAPAGVTSGQSETGVNVFKGIPYALPPVGAARWTISC